MAIQAKGLPFFPLDCTLDTKFELIEAEFGLKGFAIVVKLFQRIYGQQGYYCEWDSEVELLFSKQVNEGRNFVSEVVSQAINRNIFDRNQFEQNGILTSKGIQERFFQAAKRRQKVEVEKKYLMLSDDEIPSNVCIIGENANISRENAYISKQRRVKESKGEESKGYSASNNTKIDAMFEAFWASYPNHRNAYGARSEFVQLDPGEALFKEMMASLEKQKRSDQWTKDDGQFIPQAANWIRKELWKDELPVGKGRAGIAHNFTQRSYGEIDITSADMIAAMVKEAKE